MSTAVNGSAASAAAQDVNHVVAVLREQVLALCAQLARPPIIVRVSAGDVMVEVEWPSAIAAAPSGVATTVPATAEVPAVETEPAGAPGTVPLRAATVGTFYRAPEPGAKPFVSEGDTVRAGQQVGIIEAMKLMIPVEADRAGRVVELCVDDCTSVEHGQALMTLEPLS